ncbi:hypothetical protein AC630_39255 [Bradyrhizobium sp. AS23.2]|nr:hypothetical protein AC630_39255 [Bradyrhizobium sp. AS23.2]
MRDRVPELRYFMLKEDVRNTFLSCARVLYGLDYEFYRRFQQGSEVTIDMLASHLEALLDTLNHLQLRQIVFRFLKKASRSE